MAGEGVDVGLHEMIGQEQYREILEALSPRELVVVALLIEYDLSLGEIADELDLTKQAVSARLNKAAKRVAAAFPERAYQAGRLRRYNRPIEDNWERHAEFVCAVVDLQDRGELATLAAVGREIGQGRSSAWRTFTRLRQFGLVDYGASDGWLRPVRLTIGENGKGRA